MDHEEDETFKQFTNNAADDNAEIYFGLAEDLTANHGILDSPALRPQTFTKFGDAQRPLGFDHVFSISPGSSPKDSSSDSSVQRQSASSSNSSGSRMHRGNIPIAKDYVTAWDAQECTSGSNVEHTSSYADISESGALDFRKPTPEHGFNFGYGSDISTQVGYGDSVSYSPLRHVAMPFRSSPKPGFMARQGRGHRAGASAGPNGGSPISPVSKIHPAQPIKDSKAHPGMSWWPGTQCNKATFNGSIQQPANRHENHSGNQNSSENTHSKFYSAVFGMPAAISMPVTSPITAPSYEHTNPMASTLKIHQKNDKSRVETQIPIKLILHPMPLGVTKLHLPSHTVSKPKQLADPSLSRSPDMLELDCMLVCTTAMRDEVKRQTAFACAASVSNNRGTHTESNELSIEEDPKPCDGGRVRICSTCITREEKRAGRKKAKLEDRAELWHKLAQDRVVIFNSNEVVDWQMPSELDPVRDSATISTGYKDEKFSSMSFKAMQIELPMRIACYCRHQDEKLGFQVIFTLKDHHGRCIAQSITNSITITDDHKTSTPLTATPQNRSYPESMQLPGAGVFSQESSNCYLEGSMRQAQSFPNLQAAQNLPSFQAQPSLQPLAYTTPHILPPHASSTMTPHSLSRQVSPSAPSGPYQKKRKPSGPGKVSNELAMTKLHSHDNPIIPGSDAMPPGLSIGMASTTSLASPKAYDPFYSLNQVAPPTSMPARYNTNPPTPIRSEISWPTPSLRSQSMENISLGLHTPRTPPDLMNISHENSSSLPQNHLDGLVESIPEDPLRNARQAMLSGQHYCGEPIQERLNQLSYPTIRNIAPLTGSIAGGVEVICIGTGFYQGLEIVFGDTLATTKSYLGESCIICILPPTTEPASVLVHCNHDYQGTISWPPIQQIYFTYVDDNELQLLRLALTTLNHRMTGRREDARKIAHDTINGQHQGSSSHDDNGQNREQQNQVSGSINALTTSSDFEVSLLGCLDLMDLDDSPNQPRYNSRGPNGQSMLHFSASLGYYRFAAALLARGANPDLRDQNGMSPMHMASLNSHPNLIRKLRSAGGDPTLRSLRGFTPADMASTNEVRDVFDAIENFAWPRGFGATPTSRRSRASSTSSSQPFWRTRSMSRSIEGESDLSESLVIAISDQEDSDSSSLNSHVPTPAQSWARSRRNSAIVESPYLKRSLTVDRAGSDRLLAAATAWSVWRDQLITQVQVLQQTVHRTLPALPIPTLPPIPNLPDYQAYPVVRRISSLVPQRYPRALIPDLKESDYHWWELLRGTAAPPAYEELYPDKDQKQRAAGQVSAKTAAGETFANAKCSTVSAQTSLGPGSILDTVKIDNTSLTLEQRNDLMIAHAIKVKRLRSDRKLFFFWIPLLVVVLVAMLKDRVTQIWHTVNPTFLNLQIYFLGQPAPTA